MIKNVFNSRTKTITFAAFLLAVSSLVSRFLGLARDRLLAGRFGAGEELDIYFAAFRIPDFVYGILIAGGISAAFLPVFSEYFRKEKFSFEENKKWPFQPLEFVNNVLNSFLLLLIVISAVLAFFAPLIIKPVVPGFSPESKALVAALTRIMFLSPIIFGLSSIFSGILHYFDRFLVYSLAPILYNLGIIFGIVFLTPFFGLFGLAYGVILGALFHLLIQLPAAFNSGYRYLPVLNFKYPGLKKIFKLIIPRIIGSAAYHVNLIVLTALASTFLAGSIAIFNFSNNLQFFPVGIIGVSFALSSFPTLSRFWAREEKEKFLKSFSSVFRQILFFIAPISLLMFLLRAQLVRLILGTGHFGWWETRLTAASLGIFCFGVFAASLIPLLTRVFFTMRDAKTPVVIGVFSVVINIVFSFLFIFLLSFSNFFSDFLRFFLKLGDIEDIKIVALPLALSLSALIQLILLLVFLKRKLGDFRIKEILISLAKVAAASAAMIIPAYIARQISSSFIGVQTFGGVLFQTAISIGTGIFVYLAAVYVLKSPEIKIIRISLLKQFRPQEVEELEK